MTTHTVRRHFSLYNHRRYGKPWGALIVLKNGKPDYDFSGSHFWGDANQGLAGDVSISDVPTGAIVAFGQKDSRKLSNSTNDWFFVTDTGELSAITREEAFELLQNPPLSEDAQDDTNSEESALSALEIAQRIRSGSLTFTLEEGAELLASIEHRLLEIKANKQ